MTKRPVCICTCKYCAHAKNECPEEPTVIDADFVLDSDTKTVKRGAFGHCDECKEVRAAHPDEC